ncbi:c-type cytochrome [Alkalimarinus sediminis]|uniref:Cytochrome c n=1 Tax=Alkalimarinus sediminis TaxID=1632866 RepID=A0A9E8HK03_9ALTE|nr:cytochrome c [Alkalimarinus sediminis]UZW75745.1 cytochrome c [Alkalimarinus sediminis]
MSNIALTKKQTMKLATAAVALLSAALIAFASKPAVASETATRTANEAITSARAAELTHMLRHDCGSCHGMTFKGGLGPSLLPEQFKDKNVDYIKLTILHGRNGTAMPPWKEILSDSDAEWIAEFLLSGKIKQFNQ